MHHATRATGAIRFAALLAATSILLAACGGSAATTAPAGGGAASARIAKSAFVEAALKVKVGESITWTNTDGFGHTVTADDASFDSGTIAGGATFSHKFATAGTFAYHCAIHKSMTGSVTVTP
jgi:plastocyanin